MKFLSIVVFLFFIPFLTQAAEPLSVVINEIAWMGNEVSFNDEWIELYNNSNSPLNLDGWVLKAADGSPKINLRGTIEGNGFFLLERTDDNTLPEISADQIYIGALENNGEDLKLYDNLGNLIDSVECDSGWFAGDNSTKKTMERKNPQLPGKDPTNWQTSQNPGGSPKAKNIFFEEPKTQNEVSPPEEIAPIKPEKEEEKLPEVSPLPISYPDGIVFNEILPSPEGSDEKEEWIEIFNQNNFEVDLSNWRIADTNGTPKTYTFPEETKISAKGFLILSRPTTKIILNNESDGLNLFQPNGKIVDSVSYEKAPRGESYNRTESGWVWSNVLTPGKANVISVAIKSPEPLATSQEEQVEKPVSQVKNEKEPLKKELATIGEQIPEEPSNSFFILLTAFAIAIFSGIIILILKRQVKKVYNK